MFVGERLSVGHRCRCRLLRRKAKSLFEKRGRVVIVGTINGLTPKIDTNGFSTKSVNT